MQFNHINQQKTLMAALMVVAITFVIFVSKNASTLGLCEDAETGRVYNCDGGGGEDGQSNGGSGPEVVVPEGSEVPGIQQGGDAVGEAVSDFVEDAKDALDCLLFSNCGSSDSTRPPTPEERERARQEQYRASTTNLKTAGGVKGGALVPNAEKFRDNPHENLQRQEPDLPPSVVGDPSAVFTGRPTANELLTEDPQFSIYNFDSWIWGNNLDDTVQYIPPFTDSYFIPNEYRRYLLNFAKQSDNNHSP